MDEQLKENPYVGQGNNEPPSKDSRRRLLAMRAQNKEASGRNKSQLVGAKEEHDRNRERLEWARRDYERAQLDLETSEERIRSLEMYGNTLNLERQRISSLLNPIRRFSDEILARIFSLVVFSSSPDGIINILKISHVCQRWRNIANENGVLWAWVLINGDIMIHIGIKKLEIISQRVHSTPLNLEISGTLENLHQLVPQLSKFAVAGIKELKLVVIKRFNFQWPKPTFPTSSCCHVDHLILMSAGNGLGPNNEVVDHLDLLGWFPTLQHLSLNCMNNVLIRDRSTHVSLKRLTLGYISTASLQSLLHIFPNLEDLEISNSTDIRWPKDLVLPALCQFACRNLSQLRRDSDEDHFMAIEDAKAALVGFIRRHPTIRHIKLSSSISSPMAIADALHQLTSIDITSWDLGPFLVRDRAGLLLFPMLVSLRLRLSWEITLEDFESLITDRCHILDFAGDAENTETKSLTYIEIAQDSQVFHNADWKSSPLIEFFFKTIVDDSWYSTTRITLRLKKDGE